MDYTWTVSTHTSSPLMSVAAVTHRFFLLLFLVVAFMSLLVLSSS